MHLSQQKYIWDIISDVNMIEAKVAGTPLLSDWNPVNFESPCLPDPSQYRKLVGRLLYFNFTRPDLTFSVYHLNQFMQSPIMYQWQSTLHIVRNSFKEGIIDPLFIYSKLKLADLFTKSLPAPIFEELLFKMGFVPTLPS
ncbi:hypothetical protein LIER_27182 [Lithospermum erythrorhizon]|uniref:Retrovirus-related Pol polyprotein from transposon RE1 n=1 Tax=Lithospermum erythrorhizon TaxID=34254 RepID=A0AAV3REH4_LITER